MSVILTQHFWASPELRIPRIQMTYQATVPKLHLGMFCLSIGLSDRLATLTNIQESSIKSSGSWLFGNFGQNKLSSDISSRCLNEPTNEKRGPCLAATKKQEKVSTISLRSANVLHHPLQGWRMGVALPSSGASALLIPVNPAPCLIPTSGHVISGLPFVSVSGHNPPIRDGDDIGSSLPSNYSRFQRRVHVGRPSTPIPAESIDGPRYHFVMTCTSKLQQNPIFNDRSAPFYPDEMKGMKLTLL